MRRAKLGAGKSSSAWMPTKGCQAWLLPASWATGLSWQRIRAVLPGHEGRGGPGGAPLQGREPSPGLGGAWACRRYESGEPGGLDSDPAPPPAPHWVTLGTLFTVLSTPGLLPYKVGRVSSPVSGSTRRTLRSRKKRPLSSSLSFLPCRLGLARCRPLGWHEVQCTVPGT